jgi:hypothetical protein
VNIPLRLVPWKRGYSWEEAGIEVRLSEGQNNCPMTLPCGRVSDSLSMGTHLPVIDDKVQQNQGNS